MEAVLREQKVFLECLYEYRDAAKIQLIRKYGELLEEKYQEDGIFVRAYVPAELYSRVTVRLGDSENNLRYARWNVE